METAQALAIAAAAFVTSLVIDTPSFPQRAETAVADAVHNAMWRTNIEPAIAYEAADYPAPQPIVWHACEPAPKAVRL